jgi:myxalamid-type polyketide synthase MxaB
LLPPELAEQADSYHVHPVILDGCVQSLVSLLPAEAPTVLPFHVEQFVLREAVGQAVWCHGVLRSRSHDQYVADFNLLDDAGQVLAAMTGLTLRRASRAALLRRMSSRATADLLYEFSWQEQDRPERSPNRMPGTWLIFKDSGGLGDALSNRLSAQGQRCVLVEAGGRFAATSCDEFTVAPEDAGDFVQLLENALKAESTPLRGIAVLWGLDAATSNSTGISTQVQELLGGVLHLVQSLLRCGLEKLGGLWLLTRGAVAVESLAPVADVPAALWGLGRTITAEHPGLSCTLLDLDPENPDSVSETEEVSEALLSATEETEHAWRGRRRLVPRLRRLDQTGRLRVPDGDFALGVEQKGKLESLRIEAIDGLPPGPGQVRVRVLFVGLNFRDVLNALGLYPGEPGPMGSEFAGEVLAVGEGVDGLAPGDEVFGLAIGAFASAVTVPAAFCVKKPAALSTIEAASIPIAFTTAQVALDRAKLRSGQRVLIHAGAGGVGLAAIGLARRMGAEVFATASPAKHAFLRSQGVLHVFNSRNVEFAAQIRQATGGRGVDVALNSLSGGDFIRQTLGTLAPGGCFVEIGKRNVWTTDEVARLRSDVRYELLALDELISGSPEIIAPILRDLAARFERGELKALRHAACPLVEAPAAFRLMQQGLHVGKIVVRVPSPSNPQAEATYLITGGLGALGLETAQWLAKRGARHIVLCGRRPPDAAAQDAIEQLQTVGCEIRVVAADVSCADEVRRVLEQIDRDLPPLRGVIHAAGLLDDGVLEQQNRMRFADVLAPKILGAYHLHEQTRDRALAFFVLYSSVASLFGGPGQGAYAAANSFLDALAQKRRRMGLAALSVNWGPWGGRGMAASDPLRRHRALAQGVAPLDGEKALAALSEILQDDLGQATVLKVDWSRYREAAEGQFVPSPLKGLLESNQGETGSASPLIERLGAAPPDEREELLIAHVQREAQRVLGLAALPDPKRGFFEMGMDSLMTIELRNRLQSQLGETAALSSTLAFDYPTVNALAACLARTLFPDQVAHNAAVQTGSVNHSFAELAAELKHLPAEDIASLLKAEIVEVLGRNGAP